MYCVWSDLLVQVLVSLQYIETCATFADFVKAFSQFGNDMVQLAHLSGDRQNVSIYLTLFLIKLIHYSVVLQDSNVQSVK